MASIDRAVVLVRTAVNTSAANSDAAIAAIRADVPASVTVDPFDASSIDTHFGADLVLIDAGVRLPDGWFDRLRTTAHADLSVATVSALRLDGEADGQDNLDLLPPWPAPPPRLPASSRGCVYIRRSALELAGSWDDGFDMRCSAFSLLHVLAPDVPMMTAGAPASPPEAAGEDDPLPLPARRARQWAEGTMGALDVTIDGRSLTSTVGGTQVHALELVKALHRTRAVDLRVALPIDPADHVVEALTQLDGVTTLDSSTVDQYTARTSIVHRSHQVTGPVDMLLLRRLGRRLVVTHQDLIGFHNPKYHAGATLWSSYRRLTVSSLGAADLVLACSRHTRADLLAEDLISTERIAVVPLGTDHLQRAKAPPVAPVGAERIGDAPFLLVLGSDLLHKNRPFAIRLLGALRERHSWQGRLVFAGPHVAHGSSREQETAAISATGMAEHVVELGALPEPAKAWLLSMAAAVLYPTTYEGFGLIPFEAASYGRPCLFAAGTSLADLLPEEALLVPWDPAASADRVLPVLVDAEAAAAHVGRIRSVGQSLTWDRTAAKLVACYQQALASPPREAASTAFQALEAEERRGYFERRYWHLHNDLGSTGMALVGSSGLLPDEAQRTLAALARRRITRALLLSGLAAVRRLARVS